MFDGKKIKIGDTEYVVPALTLKQLRNGALEKIKEHDQALQDEKGYHEFVLPIRAEIILMALNRNYPDLDGEKLDEILDLENVREIWTAVLGLSGIDQTPRGEGTEAPSPLPTTSGGSTET